MNRELWDQFGAAIDMLDNAMAACPDEVWGSRRESAEFWYLAYHTLFFLDYYLSESADGFTPPAPFTLAELDPAGVLPERVYSRAELRAYLEHGRRKCRRVIESLTEARAREPRVFGSLSCSLAELLLYNLRHVQHHAGQLHLLLRQRTDSAPRWVARAKEESRGA